MPLDQLVLASGSPRRKELLQAAGIRFTVRVPHVPEIRLPNESPHDYVQRLAREKAHAVDRRTGETILGADTTVVVDEHVLEKPRDDEDATRMLALLSGREHQVLTGICLRSAERSISDVAVTHVQFAPLTSEEIAAYVESGEPRDKAGAYAIQGLASKFVTGIRGCYSNVVGLPVSLVYRHLKAMRL
ncbi:MAG: septum formation inhibitor Maf [Acidobacteriaceae bacterium]|nr:septum formation inhibitor Maf [Acidobacteriaceae bacterium]